MGSVVIIGAGAIGTWLAARIASSAHHDVTLIARDEAGTEIRSGGIHVDDMATEQGRDVHIDVDDEQLRILLEERDGRWGYGGCIPPPDGEPAPRREHVPESERITVFVTVRAYQTREAAEKIAFLYPPEMIGSVVTLQNGLGNAEILAKVLGKTKVVAGTTSHGVTSLRPGHVVHAGMGDTAVGPWTSSRAAIRRARRVAQLLADAGIPTTTSDDPRDLLWRKVVVNAAINPLTAHHGVPNGALVTDSHLAGLSATLAREAASVARAEGVPILDDEAVASARRVAERTARNRSSMLQAREAGKPLETDAITGEVVRRAAHHGIPVPESVALLEALRA